MGVLAMGAAAARARAAARDRIEESFMVGGERDLLFFLRGEEVEVEVEVKDWD